MNFSYTSASPKYSLLTWGRGLAWGAGRGKVAVILVGPSFGRNRNISTDPFAANCGSCSGFKPARVLSVAPLIQGVFVRRNKRVFHYCLLLDYWLDLFLYSYSSLILLWVERLPACITASDSRCIHEERQPTRTAVFRWFGLCIPGFRVRRNINSKSVPG